MSREFLIDTAEGTVTNLLHVPVRRLGYCHYPVMRSKMFTSVSQFLFISLLMVSKYPNFGLPLGLTPASSTSMSSTVLVVWLSSLRLTCPYQRHDQCQFKYIFLFWSTNVSLFCATPMLCVTFMIGDYTKLTKTGDRSNGTPMFATVLSDDNVVPF